MSQLISAIDNLLKLATDDGQGRRLNLEDERQLLVLDGIVDAEARKAGLTLNRASREILAARGDIRQTPNTGLEYVLRNNEIQVAPTKQWLRNLETLRGVALILIAGPEPQVTSDEPSRPVETEKADNSISVEERALQVLVVHPEWTNKQIAEHIDCHVKSLAKSNAPRFYAARQARKAANLPRGSKSADGDIEAWDE